jgi:hypothetical protein
VKAFKKTDKYPVYVLRFRMKGGGGKGRNANNEVFTLEPFLEARIGGLSPAVGRSPLMQRQQGGHDQDGRLSPPVDIIPKVCIFACILVAE